MGQKTISRYCLFNVSPIKNLKEALNMSTGIYCNIHLLEIMRRSNLQVPFILSILLGSTALHLRDNIKLNRID
jgi:hypothetical protein